MLNRQELENIAILSKLEIPEDSFEKILNDMQQIVEFANKISFAKLNDEGFFGFDGLENKFRNDDVVDSFEQSEILKNCKTSSEGFFKLNLNSREGV